jgi:hypothetical protein
MFLYTTSMRSWGFFLTSAEFAEIGEFFNQKFFTLRLRASAVQSVKLRLVANP